MAFQRLLPLVALLGLFVAPPSSAVPSLHPVVLVPGNTCNQLEARLTDEYEPPPATGCRVPRQGWGWFRLWENFTALQEDPSLFLNVCMEGLVEALERVGYREGENLFGAPYDFRYAPAAPGLASPAFSGFSSSLRHLMERASQRNGNKPVVLVTHSLGGLFDTVFLDQTPLRWRRRVYGRTPLVITRDRNYSAEDMAEYLTAAGFSEDEVARYRTRALPVTLNLRAPLVPMTAMNGIGVPTVDKLVFWDGNFSGKPQLVNGDGDGQINLETVLALQRLVGADPDQPYFKSILIPNTTHKGMISDESALKRVVSEILGASS
ncbi:unnamed protein product [Triticum turgidum subsp. durum]|uniref:Lecithin-cholesterol acyltransferase-like 1 n=1 Tax=Triticum turgidum subsp. durum TaxID=4567 RepID=A0A9R0ZQL6_TRITD|nr:unnamed protein product [Triticum turgidum subsp. durum]